MNDNASYAAAGVDIEAGERAVEQLKPFAEKARRPEVLGGIGGFAGLFALKLGRYTEPVLAASTDGVGTKVAIAQALDKHDTIGLDLVAMVVDDLVVCGAEPLFLQDYIAVGKLVPEHIAAVVAGIAEGCQRAGCALLGGETAEMPGVYALGDYDLAGFIVGLVEPGRRPDPGAIRSGDVIVGLPSSGLHTNGFSLVRKVFEDVPLSKVYPELGRPLGDELLEPHRSYLEPLTAMRWKGAAHITGGGLLGNLPRCLPDGLGARLDRKAWVEPPIFGLVRKRGKVSNEEMLGTFNMGLGMVLVMDRSDLPPDAQVVGEVVRHSAPDRVMIR
jgi:phosphoribosylformylglycinamidine cyclo-ligase